MKALYSEPEMKLMRTFRIPEALLKDEFVSAPQLYRIMVEEAFLYPDKYEDNAIESLRRCYWAIMECKIYRMTPEWDALIQLDD